MATRKCLFRELTLCIYGTALVWRVDQQTDHGPIDQIWGDKPPGESYGHRRIASSHSLRPLSGPFL